MRGAFAQGLTPDIPAAEQAAARRRVELRERRLNPPEWVAWGDEPVRGCARRPHPRDGAAAETLKKRRLTNL